MTSGDPLWYTIAALSKRRPHSSHYTRSFPRSVRWKVDQDYVEELTPAQREFLKLFNDEYYGAKFRKSTEWSTEEKRQSYRDKNVANADSYAKCPPELVEELSEALIDESPREAGPTPTYLDSPEYKEARDSFREHLDPSRRELAPKPSPSLNRAMRKLATLLPGPPANDNEETY